MLNVGVIGCGYWGPNLIRNFHNNPEVEVVAIADIDTRRLTRILREKGSQNGCLRPANRAESRRNAPWWRRGAGSRASRFPSGAARPC